MRRVLLFSGGLDSFAAAWLLKPDVLLYCDLGLPEQIAEWHNLTSHLSHLPPIKNALIHDSSLCHIGATKLENEIVPMRNLYFVMLAANYGNEISLAALSGDTTPDKDQTFRRLAEETLRHIFSDPEKSPKAVRGLDFRVSLPFRDLTKRQLVSTYLAAGHDQSWLLQSRSCYGKELSECGLCRSCQRKFVALACHEAYSIGALAGHFANDPRAGLSDTHAYAVEHGRGRELNDIELAIERCKS